MRVQPGRRPTTEVLRNRLDSLDHLPIRAATARQVVSRLPDDADAFHPQDLDVARCRSTLELDPGWVVQEHTSRDRAQPLEIIARTDWWSPQSAGTPTAEVMQRLWRHSVAVAAASRWLARESGDPEPDRLVQAGLLHGIARWAIASVEPNWLVRWLQEPDSRARQALEIQDLGTDLPDLGRRLAERWGCDPLVIESAWLHDQPGDLLNRVASDPRRLALIQQAFRWAESTPWALFATGERDSLPTEPRLRILIAEVQSRCGALFSAADATPHEERMTRQCARLTLSLWDRRSHQDSSDRLLRALAESDPAESPRNWARRASALWCEDPEVTTARVVWLDHPEGDGLAKGPTTAEELAARPESELEPHAPPSTVLSLSARGQARAEVQLWLDPTLPDIRGRIEGSPLLDAWSAWASALQDRHILERRLRVIVSGVRELGDDPMRVREARLQGLVQFAAGAGHELNNPLAVIVGRAQLLLSRATDPDLVRSLGIILGQAQRTHRILRDLMFVARPPEPRRRSCRPADILRGCVAEFQAECETRGIRLVGEFDLAEATTWADPDSLNHIAESLLRNAIQATPPGGKIQVRSSRSGDQVRWSFIDSGRGISPDEGALLFDPFYCGRQAGRGLGLGLPRAHRIAELHGGSLHWSSVPGQGSSFQVRIPLTPAPLQLAPEPSVGSPTPAGTIVPGRGQAV